MNLCMGLEMAGPEISGLHIGHHNVLEKVVKYSGECLSSSLLFLILKMSVICRTDKNSWRGLVRGELVNTI